jgi:A/G-specific adenine glycosylase
MPRNLRDDLLVWYAAHSRDLPWRRTRDPYAIWVSEIMLQQTRVETVIPFYDRFLARFPTLQSLADADEDSVLAMWSGLGYYRRARLLHAGVREAVERYDGRVPEDAEGRRSLPGVGRYTAGAIGSIAFGRPEPIVDGNVARVLSRVFRIATPLGRADTERALWEKASELVEGASDPGAFNQGLMELGARVCTPASPRCDECPIAAHCGAHRAGDEALYPVARKKKAPKAVALDAVIAERGDRVWLARGTTDLFGGLWGTLLGEDKRSLLDEHGLRARLERRKAGSVKHVLTHRELTIDVWRAREAEGDERPELRLFDPNDLAAVGISTLTRKLLAFASFARGAD